MDTLAVQRALIAQGYDLGAGKDDGIYGRDTIAAIKKFQKDKKLDVEYPGTVGPKTLKALGLRVKTAEEVADGSLAPWLDACISKKGLHEQTNYEELRKFLKSDGKTLGDPRANPWCGDLVETCLALTLPNEVLPGNPYLAKNWANWGQLVVPTRGAIMSFWRQSPTSDLGHVAFYDSETADAYIVWGGNQDNKISKTTIAKNRLRRNGSRWPVTFPLPTTGAIAGAATGPLSTNEA